MNDKDTKNLQEQSENVIELVLDEFSPVSSSTILRDEEFPAVIKNSNEIALTKIAADIEDESISPVFKELAAPKLPELSGENRAKLLMQSPNQLFFYWSVKNNPFQTLDRATGGKPNSYTLVVKLINLRNDREEIHSIETEGSFWFNVDANSSYQAEVGFFATNRPFIRVMFSNQVDTPRKSPSPRPASAAEWKVSADKFAQVLDVAGFSQDAFDVALAGDDWNASEKATGTAFSRFIGGIEIDLTGIESEEVRFALLALASGVPLEYLRWRLSPTLFDILHENSSKLNSDAALAVLQEQFTFDADEFVEEECSPAVFGASLINFPRVLKRRLERDLTKFNPVSSFSIGLNK